MKKGIRNKVSAAARLLLLASTVSVTAFAADEAAFVASTAPPSTYSLSDVEISLSRTACFGTCPIYEVTLFGDGRVLFKGERFVRVEGEQVGSVEQEQIVSLLNELYANYFFDLRDSYRFRPGVYLENGELKTSQSRATDLPSQILRVRIGDYEKTVSQYFGGPPGLSELFKLVDEVAGAEDWIR